MPKTLAEEKMWAALWITWRKKKVFLVSAIQEEDSTYQVHYQYKDRYCIDFDVELKELQVTKVVEG